MTQEFLAQEESSEDCLYLNVWTPARSVGERHAVLVYLHGGGYNEGSGAVPIYDGEGLATKGVVVVTFNYRLGALGFLAHPELTREAPYRASGNYGLLDKVELLRWVRNNIAQFGGDPANVTIAGQSAGAQDVHHLTASPLAAGLFHRAIAQSGSGLSQLNVGRSLAAQEADCVKFAAARGADSLAKLRAMSWEQLVDRSSGPGCPSSPVVDGYVLPRGVGPTFAAGGQNDVPTLTGWNADESGISPRLSTTPDVLRTRSFQRWGDDTQSLLALYPFATDEEAAAAQRAMSHDGARMTMYRWAVVRGRTARTAAYTYLWTHPIPGREVDVYGAFHTAEVPYVLNTLVQSPRPFTPSDDHLADVVSSYWANFTKTGDPNGLGLPRWTAVSSESAMTMQLGAEMKMIPAASSPERFDFFNRVMDR